MSNQDVFDETDIDGSFESDNNSNTGTTETETFGTPSTSTTESDTTGEEQSTLERAVEAIGGEEALDGLVGLETAAKK